MKQVRQSLGQWVQRLTVRTRAAAPTSPVTRPVELDTRQLSQVGGGDGGGTTTSPNKTW
jgi:hypothetical protein